MSPIPNAALNGTSAILPFTGYLFIRRRKVTAHKICVLSAFATSTVFLIGYLTLRYFAGFTSSPGRWIRPVYVTMLVSHTTLAASIRPLALITLYGPSESSLQGTAPPRGWRGLAKADTIIGTRRTHASRRERRRP